MPTNKTILLTAPYFPPHMGGLERYVEELTKHLGVGEKWNVVVLTSGDFKGSDQVETVGNVRIYRLAPSIKVSNTPFAWSWIFKVRRIIRECRPDVINIHTPVPGIGEVAALFARNTPIVVTYHADSMKKGFFVVDSLIWVYEHLVLPCLLKRADHIVCSSDTVRFGFLKQYQYKSSTITPGVDTVLFTPDESKRTLEPTIQFVAALGKAEQYKGLHGLLRAIATIKKIIPNIKLVVTGTGDMVGGYKIYAKELGLESNVVFTGALVGQELVNRYQAAQVFALTSSKESFGMVALEAMACGTPVVASKVGALPEVISEGVNGYLFETGDEAELTEKLLKVLIANPEAASRMSAAACERVRQGFSWGERAGRYEQVFSQLTDPDPLIVQIGAYYPPALGGVEKVIETTAKSLAKVGRKVLVLTSDRIARTEMTIEDGVAIKRIPSFELAHVPIAPTLSWHLWRLPRTCLVHFHLAQAYWPERVFMMCAIRRMPYIVHFHLDIEPSGMFGMLFVLYKKLFWGPFLRHATEVIVCAEQQKSIVIDKYHVDPRRVTVILNAVSEDFFTDVPRKGLRNPMRLLYVGRLSAQKRVERLVEMMVLIKPGRAELTIVGDGDCRAELEALVTAKGVKHVTFVGAKNSTDIKKLFASHDALVISSDREGMPLVVLEAMAAGVPVIGSKVIGITELVENVGVLVDAPYPENFARTVETLSQNPTRIQQLSMASVLRARQFSWAAYNEKVAQVYHSVFKYCRTPFSRGNVLVLIATWWALFVASSFTTGQHAMIARAVLGFSFIVFVPGFLTVTSFFGAFRSDISRLVVIFGVSLFEVLLIGLGVNTIMPHFGFSRPLDAIVIAPIGSVLLLALLWIYFIRAADKCKAAVYAPYAVKDLVAQGAAAGLLILSVAGAFRLNSGGDGLVTLGMLFGIAALSVFVVFKKGFHEHTIPVVLYCVSLALLFMTSLRGDFVIGHDIQREFSVFELTKYYGFWSMDVYRDAYNACLSITILPTVFVQLLSISDAVVFKVLFQMLFAIVPVTIYLTIERLVTKDLAFIATFLFVSFSTFFTDMPFLIRQEIAFIFLVLLIFTLFGEPFIHRTSRVLPFIFAFGMVLSHYATTYTVIGLCIFVLLTRTILLLGRRFITRITSLRHSGVAYLRAPHIPVRRRITWVFALFLIVSSFIWSSVITNTASNSLSRVIKNTVAAISTTGWQANKSGDLKFSLFSFGNKGDGDLLKMYQKNFVDPARAAAPKGVYYSDEQVAQFPIHLVQTEKNALTKVGMLLTLLHIPVGVTLQVVKQFFAKSLQLFIVLGFFGVLFSARYLKKPVELDFALLALANFVMVAAIVLVPVLSIEYGVLRAFQQSLMFLGVFTVLGVMTPLRFISKRIATGVVFAIVLCFFLSSTGAVGQLTGGIEPTLYLNNTGLYYDMYYLRPGEIEGLKWMTNELLKNGGESQGEQQLYPNAYVGSHTIMDSNALNTIYPGLIRRDAYVFLTYYNTHGSQSTIMYNDSSLTYSYPIEFLETYKKLVYDNGTVKIYK